MLISKIIQTTRLLKTQTDCFGNFAQHSCKASEVQQSLASRSQFSSRANRLPTFDLPSGKPGRSEECHKSRESPRVST